MLLISEMIDRIGDAKVFTKLDLQWGFNNVRIKEGDEWKAAFTCHEGLFEPLVMYFGLTNSPSTLQTMMNALFFDMGACVMVYMDDILIYTKTKEGHDEIVLQVLEILQKNDLFVKAEKCEFKVRTVKFLGLIIGSNSVSMNPKKVDGILKWPIPTEVKEVQSLLGLANFFHRFIKDFSKIATPLHKLTCKDAVWSWGSAEQKAFDELKWRFTEKLVLSMVEIGRAHV